MIGPDSITFLRNPSKDMERELLLMDKFVREVVVVAAAVILMIVPILVYGQGPPGKIVGTVKDPNGASVSGAEVSLLNPHQAVIRATVTGVIATSFRI